MQPTHHRRLARDLADQVVLRAEHLPPQDRSLLLAVYADGRSVKDLAALTREDPRRLGRHVRRLTHRILSNAYIFVVRHRDDWPTARRRIATACIVHGRTLKEAAADTNTSFYNARKQLDAVRALLDSITHVRSGRAAKPHEHGDEPE
jgi:hypothetical protein